jgi:hypothetical protein
MMRRIFTVLTLLLGLSLPAFSHAQSNLPPCPAVDYSKHTHTGVDGRTGKWHLCYGRYTFELEDSQKGNIYEGEFQNGTYNGIGTFTTSYTKHFGEWKDGKKHGQGIESRVGRRGLEGTWIVRLEGTWINNNFYRSEKINLQLVNQQTDGAINEERKRLDASRQALERSTGQRLPPLNQQTQGMSIADSLDFSTKCEGLYAYRKKGDTKYGNSKNWQDCFGESNLEKDPITSNYFRYIGRFQNGDFNGYGIATYLNGDKYEGIWVNNLPNGNGTFTYADGRQLIGEFKDGKFVGGNSVLVNRSQISEIDQTSQKQSTNKENAKIEKKFSMIVSNTQPNADGDFRFDIRTNVDTASLKINGEEQGGREDGIYSIAKVARAGQDTSFTIIAKDVSGNMDSKTISVSRPAHVSQSDKPRLNLQAIIKQPARDAVAIVIGISNYKNLPKADFAKEDAQDFVDYAIRALGVKPEKIKLLLDEQAEVDEIYTAFKTWLPTRVNSTTDVYVFYSGHGLPAQDGQGLYWMPYRANRDLIAKTAVQLQEISADIQASKPKSVTIFMDACYSGQSRSGETLLANARPLAIKAQTNIFPSSFTVLAASQADQISSSSPELKHGIFSYFLMKGMEGDADANKDGKITLGEMHGYLAENVGRQAGMMNRKQEPQLIGDVDKVLIGR